MVFSVFSDAVALCGGLHSTDPLLLLLFEVFIGETHLLRFSAKVVHICEQRVLLYHLMLDLVFQPHDVLCQCHLVTPHHPFIHLNMVTLGSFGHLHGFSGFVHGVGYLYRELGRQEALVIVVCLLLLLKLLPRIREMSGLVFAPAHHLLHLLARVTYIVEQFALSYNLTSRSAISGLISDVLDLQGSLVHHVSSCRRLILLLDLLLLHSVVVFPLDGPTNPVAERIQELLGINWRHVFGDKEPIDDSKENIEEEELEEEQI
mmetsp:Transcript_71155/g.123432  ORF Transcript_71155/g.123432 Transcript_71155/m.123432 type:complete len:261 (-) Transcript_71155:3748-4530(-)